MSNCNGEHKPIQCYYRDMKDILCNVFPEYGDIIEKLIREKLKEKCAKLEYVSVTYIGMYDKIELNYDDEVMKQQQSDEPVETKLCTGKIFSIEYIGQQEAFPDAGFCIFVYGEEVLEVESCGGEESFDLLISQEEFYNPIKYEFRRRED